MIYDDQKPRPRGRLKQLNKAMRRRVRDGKRSEFIEHCTLQEAMRQARGLRDG